MAAADERHFGASRGFADFQPIALRCRFISVFRFSLYDIASCMAFAAISCRLASLFSLPLPLSDSRDRLLYSDIAPYFRLYLPPMS